MPTLRARIAALESRLSQRRSECPCGLNGTNGVGTVEVTPLAPQCGELIQLRQARARNEEQGRELIRCPQCGRLPITTCYLIASDTDEIQNDDEFVPMEDGEGSSHA